MSQKITERLKDFVLSSGLVNQEQLQVWDEDGVIDVEHLPIEQFNDTAVSLQNEMSVTVFVKPMALTDVDKLLMVIAQFVKLYAVEQQFEWEAPRLDKGECQFFAYLDLIDKVTFSKVDGVLQVVYCNPAVKAIIPDVFT